MRVKIALASGNIAEKPLITCFKGTNGDYIILDNEANGQMGLPIICISRLEGTTVNKIVDSTEWTAVKENLKTIIGGTSLPYLPVPENLTASDEFYTQLTLPIASFELLKNAYEESQKPAEVVEETPAPAPVETPAPVEEVPAPVESPISPIDLTPIPETPAPVEEVPAVTEVPVTPLEEIPVVTEAPVAPVEEIPVVTEAPVAPVEEIPIATEVPVAPVEEVPTVTEVPVTPLEEVPAAPVEETPAVTETPVTFDVPVTPIEITETPAAPVEEVPVTTFAMDSSIVPTETTEQTVKNMSAQDLKDLKETFMKSCENMFDALVDKFQN